MSQKKLKFKGTKAINYFVDKIYMQFTYTLVAFNVHCLLHYIYVNIVMHYIPKTCCCLCSVAVQFENKSQSLAVHIIDHHHPVIICSVAISPNFFMNIMIFGICYWWFHNNMKSSGSHAVFGEAEGELSSPMPFSRVKNSLNLTATL